MQIFSWSFEIHHRLEPISKKLYLGTGEVFDLVGNEANFNLTPIDFVFDQGDANGHGNANGHDVNSFSPVSLAHDGFNVTYVGTEEAVYYWNGDKLSKLLQFNLTAQGTRHHLTFDRYGRRLLISLPAERRIIEVKSTTEPDNPSTNWLLVAGNGKTCSSRKKTTGNCGDGGKAEEARLTYPKVGMEFT